MATSLKDIKKQTLSPPRIVVYGDAGVGKTELLVHAPSPIFILTEDGLGARKVDHFPLCLTFEAFSECLRSLAEEDHKYKTVVIDSADWLEKLIHEFVCRKHKASNVDELAYGKGYTEACALFGGVLGALTALRDNKGMIITFTAHSQVRRVEDPMQPAFDAHGVKLHKKTAALLEEFCDVVLFAAETMIVKTEDAGFGNKRVRPIGTGERVMYAIGTPAFTAKNRYGLPAELPMDFSILIDSIKAAGKAKHTNDSTN